MVIQDVQACQLYYSVTQKHENMKTSTCQQHSQPVPGSRVNNFYDASRSYGAFYTPQKLVRW